MNKHKYWRYIFKILFLLGKERAVFLKINNVGTAPTIQTTIILVETSQHTGKRADSWYDKMKT